MTFKHPHFLVVGPAKTGTTWLYEQLKHVDGFNMPPTKEICYFNELNFRHTIDPANAWLLEKYGVAPHELAPHFVQAAEKNFMERRVLNMQYAFEQKKYLWGLFYRYFPRNTGWFSAYCYSLLFKECKHIISGDISPLYFPVKEEIIADIARRFPDLKIIFIIREPLERAWSNIRMNYYSALATPGFTIESYLAKPSRGADYQRAITNWENHFPPNRILYLFYNDLEDQPRQFLQQFIDFVKPGAKIKNLINEKVGRGVEKEMEPTLRMQLLKINLPQYQFLSQKFGAGSYPEAWLKQALIELDQHKQSQ